MSVTIDRAALSCSLPNVSVTMRMLDSGLTLTFLDAEGEYLGTWLPARLAVFVTSTEIGHAETADEAARMLLAYEPAPKKAPKAKASKKASPKTPSQATAREARSTKKETIVSTTPRKTLSLATTNARIDGLESTLAEIKALLSPTAPAKTPKAATRTAPATKASTKVSRCKSETKAGTRCQRDGVGGYCGSHKPNAEIVASRAKAVKARKSAKVQAPVAKPATKGSRAVAGGSGLSRSAWNKTLTTKARMAGKGKGGKSVYSLVTAPEGWAKVQDLRSQGKTPDEVLARFTK